MTRAPSPTRPWSIARAALASLLVAGCNAYIGAPGASEPDPLADVPPSDAENVAALYDSGPAGAWEFTAEETTRYLGLLARPLAGRVLNTEELARARADRHNAIAPVLYRWGREPGMVEAARIFVQQLLSVSGSRNGIDFELPGNLAAHVVRHELPWATILTSPTCYDAADRAVPCDTGAPYAAGVLATRAYMASRASRFNLTRSTTMMRSFACRTYPLEDTLEPRVARATLIPMFRAMNAAEQTDERARGGFGNGQECYTCHGQFAPHAQLFVRFDEEGLYRATATGLQDPTGELGRSVNGLMASHRADPAMAPLESSQMFGQPVANLAEAARVIAQSAPFVECSVRRVMEYTLGLDDAVRVDGELLHLLAARLRSRGRSPTFQQIVFETFSDPRIVRATLDSFAPGGTPTTPRPDAGAAAPTADAGAVRGGDAGGTGASTMASTASGDAGADSP